MDPNTLATTSFLLKLVKDLNIIRWFKIIKLDLLPPNFNVGVSIDDGNDKTSKIYHKELSMSLLKIVDQYNLKGQIKINDFSDLKTFKKRGDAEYFRNDKSLDLLIWGDFSPDILKISGKNVVQPRLNFTFGHPKDAQNKIRDMILLEIGSLDKAKNISKIIENDESFTEIKKLPVNVFQLGVYIIALSLKLFGRFDKSILLFESIFTNNIITTDNSEVGIRLHLINLYTLKLQLYNWVNSSPFESKKALEISTKLLNLDTNNITGLVAKAYHEYKLGYVDSSEETIKKLQSLYPDSHFTWIDIAFISIVQKKYKNAYDYYDRFTNVRNPNIDIMQIIEFLESQFDADRSEPAFLFASGFINTYFADQTRGCELLKIFISRADENTYKFMYRRAKKLILYDK